MISRIICMINVPSHEDKNEDGLLPSSEYMKCACRDIHHTCIHSDAQGTFIYTIAKLS